MSMYRFMKGTGGATRLFVQGTREGGDRDDINGAVMPHQDNINDLQAVYTRRQLSTEVLGSTVETTKTSRRPSSGRRSVTTRIVRKTTTLTRGEEHSVAESLVRRAGDKALVQASECAGQQPGVRPKRAKVEECLHWVYFVCCDCGIVNFLSCSSYNDAVDYGSVEWLNSSEFEGMWKETGVTKF
jgi:hypothetical protein